MESHSIVPLLTKKDSPCGKPLVLNGDPGGIRTPGLLIRSQALYPAELRSHGTLTHSMI